MALLNRQDEVVEARHACTCATFALAWAPRGSDACSQAAETAATHSGCLVSSVNSRQGGLGTHVYGHEAFGAFLQRLSFGSSRWRKVPKASWPSTCAPGPPWREPTADTRLPLWIAAVSAA